MLNQHFKCSTFQPLSPKNSTSSMWGGSLIGINSSKGELKSHRLYQKSTKPLPTHHLMLLSAIFLMLSKHLHEGGGLRTWTWIGWQPLICLECIKSAHIEYFFHKHHQNLQTKAEHMSSKERKPSPPPSSTDSKVSPKTSNECLLNEHPYPIRSHYISCPTWPKLTAVGLALAVNT